jgi:hypothetical protein
LLCCALHAVLLESKEQLAGGELGMQLLESWSDDPDYNMCGWYGITCDDYDLIETM